MTVQDRLGAELLVAGLRGRISLAEVEPVINKRQLSDTGTSARYLAMHTIRFLAEEGLLKVGDAPSRDGTFTGWELPVEEVVTRLQDGFVGHDDDKLSESTIWLDITEAGRLVAQAAEPHLEVLWLREEGMTPPERLRAELLTSGLYDWVPLVEVHSVICYYQLANEFPEKQELALRTVRSLLEDALMVVGDLPSSGETLVGWDLSTEETMARVHDLYARAQDDTYDWAYCAWLGLTDTGESVARALETPNDALESIVSWRST